MTDLDVIRDIAEYSLMGGFDLNEYLAANRAGDFLRLAKRIQCADGFSMSVQANADTCCHPRSNDGPWESVEVGFPSDAEGLLMAYIARPGDEPINAVYHYVPVAVVEQIVNKHGGIATGGAA